MGIMKTPQLELNTIILFFKTHWRVTSIVGFGLLLLVIFNTNNRGIETGEKSNPINQAIENQENLIPDYEPGQARLDAVEAYNQELANTASMLEYQEQVNLLKMAESYRALAGVFVLNPSMNSCYQKGIYPCLVSFWSGRISQLENKSFSPDTPTPDNVLSFDAVNQNRQRITSENNTVFESKALLLALILSKEPNTRTDRESVWLTENVPLFTGGKITADSITPEPLTTARALQKLQATQETIGMSQGEIAGILECMRTGKSNQECSNPTSPVSY